jgi:hypothetical protein
LWEEYDDDDLEDCDLSSLEVPEELSEDSQEESSLVLE